MKNAKRIILFSLLILLLSDCAVSNVDSKGNKGMITITGTIRVIGNEPFTHLVITTDGGKDYLIKGELEKELRGLQYQRVEINGEELPPSGGFKYCVEVKGYKIIVPPK
jgi:hypothetical protein